MNQTVQQFLQWSPRFLSISILLFWLFGMIFVYVSGPDLFPSLLAFVILISAAMMAWKTRVIGGVMYVGLGVLYTIFIALKGLAPVYVLAALPLLVTGILYLGTYFEFEHEVSA